MKSALERLKELSEASRDYPSVVPLIGGLLELEAKVRGLEETKQDKPAMSKAPVNPNDLTRGNLQIKLHKVLSAAGENEPEVAVTVFRFLSSLE
jgi:hypothetical protein